MSDVTLVGVGNGVDVVAAECAAAQARAVVESRELLAEHWARWCAAQDLGAAQIALAAPVTRSPVVYQVGLTLAEAQWVALVRFDVRIGRRRWHGVVRGPVDDPIFTMQLMPDGNDDDAPAGPGDRDDRGLRTLWGRLSRTSGRSRCRAAR